MAAAASVRNSISPIDAGRNQRICVRTSFSGSKNNLGIGRESFNENQALLKSTTVAFNAIDSPNGVNSAQTIGRNGQPNKERTLSVPSRQDLSRGTIPVSTQQHEQTVPSDEFINVRSVHRTPALHWPEQNTSSHDILVKLRDFKPQSYAPEALNDQSTNESSPVNLQTLGGFQKSNRKITSSDNRETDVFQGIESGSSTASGKYAEYSEPFNRREYVVGTDFAMRYLSRGNICSEQQEYTLGDCHMGYPRDCAVIGPCHIRYSKDCSMISPCHLGYWEDYSVIGQCSRSCTIDNDDQFVYKLPLCLPHHHSLLSSTVNGVSNICHQITPSNAGSVFSPCDVRITSENWRNVNYSSPYHFPTPSPDSPSQRSNASPSAPSDWSSCSPINIQHLPPQTTYKYTQYA